jgi:hypothetical protein
MNRRTPVFTVAVLALGLSVAAQDQVERITVALTDPNRPVMLDIDLYAGAVSVSAFDGHEVVIEATRHADPRPSSGRTTSKKIVKKVVKTPSGGKGAPATAGSSPPAHDTTGLTRLLPPTALEVEEASNLVNVRGPKGQRIDLTIQVPVRTSLRLKKSAGGSPAMARPVTVRGLDGDLEITTAAGSITLTDVAGSVVAHATGGSVIATVRRVTPDRPMAFTSFRGNVDVSLPASLKANLILQTERGDVFTNFGVQVGSTASPAKTKTSGDGFQRKGRQPIRASVNGGGPDFELRTFAGSVYLRKVD